MFTKCFKLELTIIKSIDERYAIVFSPVED